MPPTIKALLLDADGVLQRTGPHFVAGIEALAPAKDKDAFLNAVFAAEAPCLRGKADFASALAQVLAEWGSAASLGDALTIWQDIAVDETLLSLVAQVRTRGVLCCVASNQQSYRARYMSETLGYERLFDREFYSYAIGSAKPEPQFFLEVMRQLDLSAEELLFVDDSARNIAAASLVGIRSEVFAANSGGDALRTILRKYDLV